MENLKNFIATYRNDIHFTFLVMFIISIISTAITSFVLIGERNKINSELTPTQFNTVKKNIENSKIAMAVFVGLTVFFGIIWLLTYKYI